MSLSPSSSELYHQGIDRSNNIVIHPAELVVAGLVVMIGLCGNFFIMTVVFARVRMGDDIDDDVDDND